MAKTRKQRWRFTKKNQKLKMDFKWTILDVNYVIRNVPYLRLDAEGEIFFDMGVSIKMAMIRDLMWENEIPHDVDFNLVADFEF